MSVAAMTLSTRPTTPLLNVRERRYTSAAGRTKPATTRMFMSAPGEVGHEDAVDDGSDDAHGQARRRTEREAAHHGGHGRGVVLEPGDAGQKRELDERQQHPDGAHEGHRHELAGVPVVGVGELVGGGGAGADAASFGAAASSLARGAVLSCMVAPFSQAAVDRVRSPGLERKRARMNSIHTGLHGIRRASAARVAWTSASSIRTIPLVPESHRNQPEAARSGAVPGCAVSGSRTLGIRRGAEAGSPPVRNCTSP